MRDPLPLGSRVRLPLGFQVLAGIGGLVALLGASVLIAVLLVLNLRGDQAELTDHNVPYASAVAAAALNAKGIANDERGYLISGDQRFVDELERRIDKTEAAFARASAVAVGGAQEEAARRARTGFDRWVRAVRSELATFRFGDRQAAIDASLGPGRALRKEYEASLVDADVLAASAIRSQTASVADESSRSVVILLVCLIVTLLVGTGLALWVVRTILRPVYAVMVLFAAPETGASRDQTR